MAKLILLGFLFSFPLPFLSVFALAETTSKVASRVRKLAQEPELKLELIKVVEFSAKHNFKKTRVGGISGLVYDPETQILWAVSDDRGKLSPPRVYKIKINKDLSLDWLDVVFVKDKKEVQRPVYDLEAISLLPWGNLLLTSEGDDRARPARPHRIFEIKTNGDYVRDYDLPEVYKPGKGSEPKGLRTNFGFEAMGMTLDGKSWLLGSESWLAQDSENIARLLTYDMKEAWVLTPGAEYLYKPNFEVGLVNGLTDVLNWKENRWLFLERTAFFEGGEIKTHCQIVDAKVTGKDPIQGKTILDFKKVKFKDLSFGENYEAMTIGPNFEGSRILIVANDNNFLKSPTQFLFFKMKDESTP